MKHRIAMGATLAIALLASSAFAAETLKSGLQPGEKTSPFNPLHVNGSDAGEKVCLV